MFSIPELIPPLPHTHTPFSKIRVPQSLVFCVVFCRSLFILLSIFFWPIVLFVLLFMDFDYPFGISKLFLSFWPLYCLSFDLRILITPLVSSNFSYILVIPYCRILNLIYIVLHLFCSLNLQFPSYVIYQC